MKADNKISGLRADEASLLRSTCPVDERAVTPLARAKKLAYATIQRPDLDKAERFFVDFGLLVAGKEADKVYFRGRATENIILVIEKGPNAFKGLGLVADQKSLQALSENFLLEITPQPAILGGTAVHLVDPNGYEISVCHGLAEQVSLGDANKLLPWNHAEVKPRVGVPVRLERGPRTVNKLGHCVLSVARIKESVEWYQQTLGLIVSDFQFAPGEALPTMAFMRFDSGETPVDHHSIGIAGLVETGHVHSAFEMDNLEEIGMGSEWLQTQGYKHSWGIGRHALGSQIFDYWREPRGDLWEHYADGDLFNSSVETGYELLHSKSLHQWGPEVTKDFTGENRPLDNLKAILRRLASNDDLTFGRLKRLFSALKN